jgi:hypothetical protein
LIATLAHSGYEKSPRAAASAVPDNVYAATQDY